MVGMEEIIAFADGAGMGLIFTIPCTDVN